MVQQGKHTYSEQGRMTSSMMTCMEVQACMNTPGYRLVVVLGIQYRQQA